MRALFLEVLVDIAVQEGLGIAHNCLHLVRDHVDQTIQRHSGELMERDKFIRAYADYQEFVLRMARDAKSKNYQELHEDTYYAARTECGLIWWCE
jgi:hypothetical protein